LAEFGVNDINHRGFVTLGPENMGYGNRIWLKDLITRGGYADEVRGYRMIRKRPDAAASAARSIGARENDQDSVGSSSSSSIFVFMALARASYWVSAVRNPWSGWHLLALEDSKNTRDKTTLPA
jgi:hypothetical protein